jgi:predicted GNAT family acetyltransferase
MTATATERAVHEPERRRFKIVFDEGLAVLEYRRINASTLDYHHTFVPPQLRGRGLASEVTAFALRYARDRALKVVPTCPFVATYLDAHPELEDVRAS